MSNFLRALTGTSQGATPLNDTGARAAILLVVNAISQYFLDYLSADVATRQLVATIENPALIIIFGVWDKIDSILQAQAGITTAPTPTP